MNFGEILVILIVALLVLGPKRMPQAAQWLGQMTAQAMNLFHELQQAVERKAQETDYKNPISTDTTTKGKIYEHDKNELDPPNKKL
jgi:sec-independent protein translocase protein TatB